MPKIRYIKKLSKKFRIIDLFNSISNVFKDKQTIDPKNNTDIIGYSLQYLGTKWNRKDFDEILDLTVREIIELVDSEDC